MAGDAAQEVEYADRLGLRGRCGRHLLRPVRSNLRAAIGSIVPGLGTAVGAAIGGALGLITGGAQAFQNKDEAFKSYAGGGGGQLSAQKEAVTSGSSIAGGREQKQMAFTTCWARRRKRRPSWPTCRTWPP